MPGTAQAALVFLVIVVPGFLAMAGYRLGRAVPLVATARVIAVSAFVALIAWKLGGSDLYDHVRAGTALTQPYVFVRVTTRGGREVVGTVADASRIAVSPQPRDLDIEQTLRQGENGTYYPTAYGLGAFVAGTEIETVEWVSQEGVVTDA